MTSLSTTASGRSTRRAGHRSRSVRSPRAWLVAFLGFFLLGAAWSFAAPYDGPPDELEHVVRAYGLMSGQLSDKMIVAPQGLIAKNAGCARWHHDASYACNPMPGTSPGDYGLQSHKSSTYSYPPFYYYVVGLPIKLMPDMRGIIVARLLTDAMMSAVLAACVAVAGRLRAARWMLPAMIVAATPVMINLAGAVNPAGPEIAFGFGLSVAIIALVDLREVSRGVAVLTGVCATGLAVTRGFGLGWFAAIFAVGALGLTKEHARVLWRSRELRIAGAVTAVGVLAALWWHFTHATALIAAGTQTIKLTNNQLIAMELWDRSSFYTVGLVSQTSYGDVPVPPFINYVWFGAAGLLILGALAVGTIRDRLRIAAIIVVSYLALFFADYSALKNGFWESQGRYVLPFIVCAPLLAAHVLNRSATLQPHWPRLGRLFACILLPIQLIALAATMIRWQQGQNDQFPIHLDPFRGSWLPIWGPVAPIAFCLAGILLVAVVAFMRHPTGSSGGEEAERERQPDAASRAQVSPAL